MQFSLPAVDLTPACHFKNAHNSGAGERLFGCGVRGTLGECSSRSRLGLRVQPMQFSESAQGDRNLTGPQTKPMHVPVAQPRTMHEAQRYWDSGPPGPSQVTAMAESNAAQQSAICDYQAAMQPASVYVPTCGCMRSRLHQSQWGKPGGANAWHASHHVHWSTSCTGTYICLCHGYRTTVA